MGITGAIKLMAEGNFDMVLPGLGRKDEIGDIAGAVEALKLKAIEKAQNEAHEVAARQAAEAEAAAQRQKAEAELAARRRKSARRPPRNRLMCSSCSRPG